MLSTKKYLLNLNKLTYKLCFVLSLTALNTTKVYAQQKLPEINIVKYYNPIIEQNNISDFSNYSTSVGENQIKELGGLDLTSALRRTPGVQISRYDEVGTYSGDKGGSVYIRGMGASRPGSEIKTYLDDIPVYMGLWNHPLIDLLPLNGVSSIEINKGPHNEVSGNNFGSINLKTKTAITDGAKTEVDVSAGSFDTKITKANIVGKKDKIDYLFAGSHISSNGDRKNSEAELSNFLTRLGYKINDNLDFGITALNVNNRVSDPGDNRYATSSGRIGPYNTNGVARNDSETTLISPFIKHKNGDFQGEIKIYQNHGHNNLYQDANWNTFYSKFDMKGLKIKEEFLPANGVEVVASLEHDNISGLINGPGSGGDVNTPEFEITSGYLGTAKTINMSKEWALKPSVGVRQYYSNIYDSKISPNVGVSLLSNNLTLFANYNKAILYPGAETYSLVKALSNFGGFSSPSRWDNLSPTEDNHLETGFKWSLSPNTQVDASIFQDEISKRYVWTYGSTWSNNSQDYKIKGAELSLTHKINNNWSLFGGFTTLDKSIEYIPYIPSAAASVGLTGNVEGYKVSFDAQHQTNMYSNTQDRKTGTTYDEVDHITVANARISRPLQEVGEMYLIVNNIFNSDYEYNAGYPMPGRNFRIGFTSSF